MSYINTILLTEVLLSEPNCHGRISLVQLLELLAADGSLAGIAADFKSLAQFRVVVDVLIESAFPDPQKPGDFVKGALHFGESLDLHEVDFDGRPSDFL
jgi:hypothetical protein